MLLSVYERKGHITIDLCRLCVSVRASVRLSVTTRQRRHGFAVDSLVLHFFSPRLFFFDLTSEICIMFRKVLCYCYTVIIVTILH